MWFVFDMVSYSLFIPFDATREKKRFPIALIIIEAPIQANDVNVTKNRRWLKKKVDNNNKWMRNPSDREKSKQKSQDVDTMWTK